MKGILMLKKIQFVTLALLVFSSSPLLAVDYWGGPPAGTWERGAPGTTYQHWQIDSPVNTLPEIMDNPYAGGEFGDPTFVVHGAYGWGTNITCPGAMDPSGTVSGFLFEEADGGSIELTIPNSLDNTPLKAIFVQITATMPPISVEASTWLGAGVFEYGTWDTGLPAHHWSGFPQSQYGGQWHTYNYGLTIEPNPPVDVITITMPYHGVIDQIVVDTICTSDPVASEQSTWSDVKALYRD